MTQADHVAVVEDEHGVGQQDRGRRSLASPQRLRSFFAPRSIALVGASEGSGWARFILDSLSTSGFTGELRLVHPVRPQAFGRPTVPSLRALDEPVDLAFVLAPTRAVEGVLEDAAAAGIHNVVVLASGYGDGGGEEGRERERRLVERAVELDLTLLGPNCLGFVNAAAGVAPFGLHIVPPLRRGGLGVVLQSGALTSNVLAFARAHGIGISLLTSMGNEAVITAADVIEHLIDDDDTRVIGLFLESVRDPQRFTALAERALQVGKPIVALKVGRSPAGQLAALAHTGAVAGDDAVVAAAFRQFGVTRVDSLEELLITAGLLGSGTVPTGRRMGVVTASGGACDIIADRSADEGVEIPEFSESTGAQLRELLPSFAAARNPLDVTGVILADTATASANLGGTALNAVAADPKLDFVLNLLCRARRRASRPGGTRTSHGRHRRHRCAVADPDRQLLHHLQRPLRVRRRPARPARPACRRGDRVRADRGGARDPVERDAPGPRRPPGGCTGARPARRSRTTCPTGRGPRRGPVTSWSRPGCRWCRQSSCRTPMRRWQQPNGSATRWR